MLCYSDTDFYANIIVIFPLILCVYVYECDWELARLVRCPFIWLVFEKWDTSHPPHSVPRRTDFIKSDCVQLQSVLTSPEWSSSHSVSLHPDPAHTLATSDLDTYMYEWHIKDSMTCLLCNINKMSILQTFHVWTYIVSVLMLDSRVNVYNRMDM